ncbi:hypothetical protein PSHT_08579 [Puccinia striiformis]|uniref:O-methyltransferase C-terminal domain-containing protein n=1 Tax=Puccinia striiformis TaxID=27350 RepID=A0A2S4VND7_9BASI|nr:hypothetical protein PSHT_08579 [Puccinia striiformis]
MPVSAAQQLAELILQAVKDIEADTATQIPGAQTTDINLPTVAAEDDLEATPHRRAALRTLKGATHQLLATLSPAGLYVQELHHTYLQTTALDIASRARIADLIYSIDADSNKGGVHVEILAEKAGMDSRKLTHVLRFLAIRNVFVEEKLDHFSNNRHSFPLRTDSANTMWNALGHLREELGVPAFVELPEVLLDKEGGRALSWDHAHSAFQKYYEPGCDFFEFLARSKDGYRAERFGKTMHYKKIASKANVEFEEADFFKEQPPHRAQEVDVYFLRHILHDWPAKACVEILTQLRKAAKPTSRLLIAETGLEPPLLDRQSPILANGGMATSVSHNLNLSMMTLFNGEERGTQEFTEIFGEAGWKLESVSTLTTVLDRFIFEGVPDPSWKQ